MESKQKIRNYFITACLTFVIGNLACGEKGPKVVTLDSSAPLIQVRVAVNTGSSDDPQGFEGLAYLTGQLILEGSYGDSAAPVTKEKLAEMTRPWGENAKPSARVAKELTTFYMTVPAEVFAEFNEKILSPMFTKPLFNVDELERIRKETIQYIESTLRLENTEMLGLYALDSYIHEGTSYGHPAAGTVSGLKEVTQDQVKRFYATHYKPENVTVALGTNNSEVVRAVDSAITDIGKSWSEVGTLDKRVAVSPPNVEGRKLTIVSKPNAISTGLHAGFPINVKRGDPDYWPLYVANVFFGTHRDGFSHLYKVIRQRRGYNYGDYSYVEWFDEKPFNLFPPPNTPRKYQYFSIWIRPVGNEYAHHILKAFMWELDNFIENGLTEEECTLAKNKAKVLYLNLAETTSRLVSYKLDDQFYGLSDGYLDTYLDNIDALSCDQINGAIKQHLQSENVKFVVITDDDIADQLKSDIANNVNAKGKSNLDYNIEFEVADGDTLWKPTESQKEMLVMDKMWEAYPLRLSADDIQVVNTTQLFETSNYITQVKEEENVSTK